MLRKVEKCNLPKNHLYKKSEKDPDYIAYIAPKQKKEESDNEDVPF